MTRNNGSAGPPALARDEIGDINTSSLADVIEWFLTYDQRAGVIRHPKVEEIFHCKQEEQRREGEEIYQFAHAEDRLDLTCCWIEVLCTAEVRIMGWIYKELYGKPYSP
ncbi:MAG: hypothetical protein DMF68_12935 [Acidobacteria bacterium]|nr:MAG: hypothetical protein DMF68_12935 [Acidobacteriota bacterium]